MTYEQYLNPPEDSRPVIGQCEFCGQNIHGASPGYDADEYGEIDGCMVHRDCVMDFFDKYCRKGE